MPGTGAQYLSAGPRRRTTQRPWPSCRGRVRRLIENEIAGHTNHRGAFAESGVGRDGPAHAEVNRGFGEIQAGARGEIAVAPDAGVDLYELHRTIPHVAQPFDHRGTTPSADECQQTHRFFDDIV